METRARYVIIGAFVLAVIFAGFGFVYWLKNIGGLGDRAYYRIRFEHPVSGLGPGSAVLFNGLRIGTVQSLDLDPSDLRGLVATVSLLPSTPIHADTKIEVTFQGLTGSPAILLRGGTPDSPRVTAHNGQIPLLGGARQCRHEFERLGARHAGQHRSGHQREFQAVAQRDHRHQHLRRHAGPQFQEDRGHAGRARQDARRRRRQGRAEDLRSGGGHKVSGLREGHQGADGRARPARDPGLRYPEDPDPFRAGHLFRRRRRPLGRQFAQADAGEDRGELRERPSAQGREPAVRFP